MKTVEQSTIEHISSIPAKATSFTLTGEEADGSVGTFSPDPNEEVPKLILTSDGRIIGA